MEQTGTSHLPNYLQTLRCRDRPTAQPDLFISPFQWVHLQRLTNEKFPIPDRTHTSGNAVKWVLRQQDQWPHVSLVHPADLVARALQVYSPEHGTSRPATLQEAMPYFVANLPDALVCLAEPCTSPGEEDVRKAAEAAVYHCLNIIAQWFSKEDGDMLVERHWQFASPKNGVAIEDSRVVFLDQGYVLKHRLKKALNDPLNKWLRPDEIGMPALSAMSPETLEFVKSVLLMIEFKAHGTNETHPSSDVPEWTLSQNPFVEGRDCFIPGTVKALRIFAQSLTYSVTHKADSMIVDDWKAPKVLRFNYAPGSPDPATKGKLSEFPPTATLSHLAVANRPEPDDITAQQAALFLLLDNLLLSGAAAKWFDRKFDPTEALKVQAQGTTANSSDISAPLQALLRPEEGQRKGAQSHIGPVRHVGAGTSRSSPLSAPYTLRDKKRSPLQHSVRD